MPDNFFDFSKDIAQSFIQSILFIDDKAYSPDQDDHPFDVKLMIKESADRGLIATAYAPEHQDDLNKIAAISNKADVIVLDWRIDVKDDSEPGQTDEEEEDVSDRRGEFAIQLIKKLVANGDAGRTIDQLKLIFIYTGEPSLQEICADLAREFGEFERINDYTLSKGGIRISIWAKESLAPKFTHLTENKTRLRSYTELIDEVPTEYAFVSSGLLSNTCLDALTSIRNNTYTLLAKFSPYLDPALVAHRAMLPKPDDAGELLKEIICGELNSILTNEDLSSRITNDIINKWIESRQFNNTEVKLSDKKNTIVDNEKRKLWQNEGYITLLTRESDNNGEQLLTDSEIKSFDLYRLKKYACEVFTPQNFNKNDFNQDFSILTHHRRNIFSTTKAPSLTLGTVVLSEYGYLLCIQQRCDSVRIEKGKIRKFLFLPMKEETKNVDVIHKKGPQDYVSLAIICKECHALEILAFTTLDDSGIVTAQKEGDNYYFTSVGTNPVKFQWILDLKEAHAQRIVNNFAAQLARVGLDESEWLRRP